MSSSQNVLVLIARILLSFIFITSGFSKLVDPAGTAGMITGAGLPAATALAYVAGLFELVAGLAILAGFQTKIAAWALAVFCVFTGLVFHSGTVAVPGWPEPALGWINTLNGIMMVKNITLAGAYILLAAFGAGAYPSTQSVARLWPTPEPDRSTNKKPPDRSGGFFVWCQTAALMRDATSSTLASPSCSGLRARTKQASERTMMPSERIFR